MDDLLVVFGELVRLEIELWNALDARLRRDHGLPLSRFEPMQVIQRRETCRVQDIAAELSITVGGTSKLIDRIEAAGLCRRLPNPADGRSSLIELTDEGRQVLAAATASAQEELRRRIGAQLPRAEARSLLSTLGGLRRANHAAAGNTAA